MKLEYYTTVLEDGKIPISISKSIKENLKKVSGSRIEIRIEKVKSKRSHQQNRLWWLYMNILSQELGYSKDEIHEICKYKFLKREKVNEKTGEIFEYLESTTKLNKSDFGQLTEKLIKWAAESFDIILPLPEEQIKIW